MVTPVACGRVKQPAPPTMTDIIRAEHLTKRYGRHRGVEDLSFSVREGEVFGFLGPNGAGKTTTIRMLLDLIRPTSGQLDVFGVDSRRGSLEIRHRLGYLPGDLRLYERLTGEQMLAYFASLRGMTGLGDAPALIERFDLDPSRPIRTLSRGNRQKVGLVQAFMHRPALLVLDEPTVWLDPLMQESVSELVREVVADGRTVFLSSHDLPEVQRVADRVAVIREGRLALIETVDALRARAFSRVEATFGAAPPVDAFADIPGVRELRRHGAVVLFALEGSIDPLVKALARFEVVALDAHEADLEDIFLQLYRGDANAA
jgi:ABC-2 type transport system ATP-binding protein